jgi:hypothetical protein
MAGRMEFLQRADVTTALEELTEHCFALRERGHDENEFPNAVTFLQERGIDTPGTGSLHIRHSIEPEGVAATDVTPTKVICPDGSDGCRPTHCRKVNGEWVCSWVCDC